MAKRYTAQLKRNQGWYSLQRVEQAFRPAIQLQISPASAAEVKSPGHTNCCFAGVAVRAVFLVVGNPNSRQRAWCTLSAGENPIEVQTSTVSPRSSGSHSHRWRAVRTHRPQTDR